MISRFEKTAENTCFSRKGSEPIDSCQNHYPIRQYNKDMKDIKINYFFVYPSAYSERSLQMNFLGSSHGLMRTSSIL